MPSETLRPPVDYKLARFYYQQMRFEEACEEYFKLLSYHPQETSRLPGRNRSGHRGEPAGNGA